MGQLFLNAAGLFAMIFLGYFLKGPIKSGWIYSVSDDPQCHSASSNHS